jgi:photosystem II stability/assembly factor-like uncharacterized protein
MKKRLIFVIIFLLQQLISFGQWTLTNFNSTSDVNRIKFYGTTDVWLACDTGIFHSNNNGAVFTKHGMSGPFITGSLNDVGVINATTAIGAGIFDIGNDEMIVRTTNTGASWDTVEATISTFLAQFHAVDFPTSTTGFVVGWQGRIFRSVNGGLNWSTVFTNPSISLFDVAMTSATQGAAVGQKGIYYTSNSTTWSQVLTTTGEFRAVSFNGSIGYAGGQNPSGNLYKSTNNGSTWSVVNFPFNDEIYGLQTISTDTVVVVTNYAAYKTCNGGIYWEEFVLPAGPSGNLFLRDIAFRGNEGYIGCNNGILLKTTNGGGNTKPIISLTAPSTNYCEDSGYVFTNSNPAAYTYQWKMDGATISTTLNLNITLSDSGSHVISLIASNGTMTDTASINIFVNPKKFIKPLNLAVDSICPGSVASIKILNSATNVSYRLRNGFTNVGSAQNGNGATLTFTVTPVQTTNYNILATGSNSCYTDSLVTNFSQVVFPDKFVPVTYTDSLICSGKEAFHLSVQNSQTGILYTLSNSLTVYDSVYGNGGTINLSTPILTGIGNITVNVTAKKDAGCHPVIKTISLHKDTTYSRFNVVNFNAYPGDSITFSNLSNADNYFWTFPPQANIQSSTLQNPKIVINTPGVYTIKLKTTSVEGCADSSLSYVYISVPAPPGITTYCGNLTGLDQSLVPYDSYLDKNKNLYLTGTYTSNIGSNNFQYFVIKADSLGNLVWFRDAKNYSYSENASGQGIAVDDSGNVYVAGFFSKYTIIFNNFIFDSDNLSNQKGFLIKYDSNGNEKWLIKGQKQNNALYGMWFSDVVVDSSNKIFFTGQHENGVFTFPDGSTFTATGDSTSAFLMSVDANGLNYSYTTFGASSGGRTTGGSVSYTSNPRLSLLPGNDLLITSCFSDSSNNLHTQFGSFNFTDTSNVIYASIYNPSVGFKKIIRGPSGNIWYLKEAIADSEKNIYLIGSLSHNFEFKNSFYSLSPTFSFSSTSFPEQSFIARLDSSGSGGWINYSGLNNFTDIAVTNNNDVMFTAIADTNCFLGNQNSIPQAIHILGKKDGVIGKYNKNGNLSFANLLGTTKYDIAYTINLDECNNSIVSTGYGRDFGIFWPTPNSFSSSTTSNFKIQYLSGNSLCAHDAACNFYTNDTLNDDASLVNVWTPKKLSGTTGVPVKVKLKSFGTDTLRTANIILEVDGVPQLNYNWNGNLAQYQSDDSVVIGNLTVSNNGNKILKAYVQLPNNHVDLNNANDTVYNTVETCVPLAGTYTIGAGGDFETFTSATKHLKECGLSSHVYFDVLPGIYNDRVFLDSLPTSVNDSLVFRSANGDSASTVLQWGIGYPYQNGLVFIRNTPYVTFNKITIHNLDIEISINMNIQMAGNCSHFNLWNCVISRDNPDTLSDGELFFQGSAEIDFLNFRNNLFYQGGTACSLWGPNSDNCIVSNNVFKNQTEEGIQMQQLVGPVITDNYFESNYHKSNAYVGIGLTGVTGAITISRNKIYVTNGDAIGIGGVGNFSASTPALISNNMIIIPNSTRHSFGLQYSGSSGNFNFYNNSIYIAGIGNSSSGMYGPNATNINFKNNIFIIADSGYAGWFYNFNNSTIDLDYNCYHTVNPRIFRNDTITSGGTVYYTSLAQWRAYTGTDAHSIFHNANFVSPADLHIVNDIAIENSGTPLTPVTDDFDKEPRSALTPDMGCDEFIGPNAVSESLNSISLSLFPNPVRDELNITLNSSFKNATVKIYDLTGRMIISKIITSALAKINTAELIPGNYVVEVLGDDLVMRRKFVKL